jgi:hypothetical protein
VIGGDSTGVAGGRGPRLDGQLEIVVASGAEGKIFAWHHDGAEVADGDQNPNTQGVLFSPAPRSYSSPAIEHDADLIPRSCSAPSSGGGPSAQAHREAATGRPVETHGQVTASPALANLDGDPGGRNEVVIASEADRSTPLRGDGTDFPAGRSRHGEPRPATRARRWWPTST